MYWASSFVEERASLLRPHVGELVGKHKLNGGEEIGLARSIATNYHVVTAMEWFNDGLVTVGLETFDGDSLDMHLISCIK